MPPYWRSSLPSSIASCSYLCSWWLCFCKGGVYLLIYTVQPGDSISRIALRLGSTVRLILAANQLTDPNLITPGQKLLIPVLTGTTVRVQPGDTLYQIAQRYDLPIEVIAAANALSPPYIIQPGQQLQIPVTLVNTQGCLAYQSTRANGVWDTWLRSPSQVGSTRLTFNLGGPATVPVWAPDGSRVAIVSPGGTLYVINATTGQSQALLNGLGEFADFVWSPNGESIAVEVQNQIVLVDTNTGATRFVTSGEGPAFLPDGETIIFTRAASNGQQILAINLDTAEQRLLTTISGADPVSQLDVDPSGQLVAMMQSGPERSIVLIVELATGRVFTTPLTAIGRDFFPRWSPDGQILAYNSTVEQPAGLTGQIRLVDREGNLVTDLTDTVCLGERISWSPDGQFISYPNCLSRLPQITVVGLHKGPVQITAHGINVHPNWRTQNCSPAVAP